MRWFVNQESQSEKISLWKIWRINLSFFILLRIDTVSDGKIKPPIWAVSGLKIDVHCVIEFGMCDIQHALKILFVFGQFQNGNDG